MRREDWDRRYAAVENLWSAKPNRFLVAEVESLAPSRSGTGEADTSALGSLRSAYGSRRALDLACGEGQNAIWLASLGWHVDAVDYSPVAIAKARDRAERDGVDVAFAEADLVEYEPEPAAYDLVLLLYLHLPADEHRLVLARAAQSLAPGGTLVLLGHDLLNATEGVGGPSDASLLYTPEDVAGELEGLEIEKAERVLRDVAGAERPAIDCLVRARRRPG